MEENTKKSWALGRRKEKVKIKTPWNIPSLHPWQTEDDEEVDNDENEKAEQETEQEVDEDENEEEEEDEKETIEDKMKENGPQRGGKSLMKCWLDEWSWAHIIVVPYLMSEAKRIW